MNEMEESLSVKLSTSLTPSQAAFVDKAAGIEEMSRAEYLRYLVDREMKFAERPLSNGFWEGLTQDGGSRESTFR